MGKRLPFFGAQLGQQDTTGLMGDSAFTCSSKSSLVDGEIGVYWYDLLVFIFLSTFGDKWVVQWCKKYFLTCRHGVFLHHQKLILIISCYAKNSLYKGLAPAVKCPAGASLWLWCLRSFAKFPATHYITRHWYLESDMRISIVIICDYVVAFVATKRRGVLGPLVQVQPLLAPGLLESQAWPELITEVPDHLPLHPVWWSPIVIQLGDSSTIFSDRCPQRKSVHVQLKETEDRLFWHGRRIHEPQWISQHMCQRQCVPARSGRKSLKWVVSMAFRGQLCNAKLWPLKCNNRQILNWWRVQAN